MEHWRFSCPEFPHSEEDHADSDGTRTIAERKKSKLHVRCLPRTCASLYSIACPAKGTIFIKTFDGKNITYRDVDLESATVDDMKMLIKDRQGIDPKQQRLICLGKQLEDGQLLSAYNIRDSVTVHLGKSPLDAVSRCDIPRLILNSMPGFFSIVLRQRGG